MEHRLNSKRIEILSRTKWREPRLLVGFFWMLGGILVFGSAIWVYGQLPFLLTKAIAGLGSLGAVLLTRRGKRLWQPSLRQQLIEDPRPLIVYFRCFDVDSLTKDSEAQIVRKALMSKYSSIGHHEESLAPVCRLAGPFVAIGRPHELQPGLGAARLYCTDAEWRQTVALLLEDLGGHPKPAIEGHLKTGQQ